MSKDLAVVVFAWNGSRPIYHPWHAENMQRMVAKHLSLPHRFVVVTDNEDVYKAAGLETYPLWKTPEAPEMERNWIRCYARLGLFDWELGGSIADRILAIDLDAVIRAPIDDLFDGDEHLKMMCLKSRTWIQGGLIRVDPGLVDPCPWYEMHQDKTLFERSRKWIGSDQAILSELFYDDVLAGTIPSWNETDGISINEFEMPWRIFFRTGDRKCWHPGVPEAFEYLSQSGRDGVPEALLPRIMAPPPMVPGGMTIQRQRRRGGGRGW